KSAKKKPEPVKKPPIEVEPRTAFNPTPPQREALQQLKKGRALTQDQRNLLAALQTSTTPGLTNAQRKWIADGLERDLGRKRGEALGATANTAATLRKLLDPANPAGLTLTERSAVQRLLAGQAMTSAQRTTLESVGSQRPKLSAEARGALTEA